MCLTLTPSAALFFRGTLGYVMKYDDKMFPLRNISKSLCRPSAWTVPSWPVFQCKYQSELLIQDLGQCASSIKQALILTSYIKICFFSETYPLQNQ